MKRISYNYNKVLLICAIVSIFVIVQTINVFGTEVTNHTPGEFQVGQNGSAIYTIPIKVPPGINGLEPNLSLEYNSGIKNGLLGMGWSLNGISTITRGPSTLMTDGFIDGVDFDEDDRFYLNGKRLIIANADQGYQYGDPGAEYRTEIDEFSKVISRGTAGTGPQYFEVWLKNGLKLYFGNSAESRIEAQGKDSVLIWAVNRVGDMNGNYMTVSYFEDNENGEFRPDRIEYSLNENTGLVEACSVIFKYEPRIDNIPKYVSGSVMHISERLSDVQTYVNDVLIRKYHLEYEYGEVGHASVKRSRLTSLTEFDENGNALPATVFEWQNKQAGFERADFIPYGFNLYLGDYNGDGLMDYSYFFDAWMVRLSNGNGFEEPENWRNPGEYQPWQYNGRYLFDYNGDGRQDVFEYIGLGWGDYESNAWLSTGSEFQKVNLGSGGFADGYGDFDGDGRGDLLSIATTLKHPDINGSYVFLSTGGALNDPYKWSLEMDPWGTGHKDEDTEIDDKWVGDFNGDGMHDILEFEHYFDNGRYTKSNVWLSTGSGFQVKTEWSQGHLTICDEYFSSDDNEREIGDFNGDGLIDVVEFEFDTHESWVWLSTGESFVKSAAAWGSDHLALQDQRSADNRRIGDFNGDGLDDVLEYIADSESVYVWYSTGNSFTARNFECSIEGLGLFEHVGDFNGDGMDDFIHMTNIFYAKSDYPDLLTTITNGLGRIVEVQYKPITDDTVYTKDSSAQYPFRDYGGPMYVVSNYTESNGIGTVNPYSYTYEGAKIDLLRRKFQGFESVTVYDHQKDLYTTTSYLQKFPFSGMVKKKEVRLADDTLVSSKDYIYRAQVYIQGDYTGYEYDIEEDFIYDDIINTGQTYFPYIETKVENDYFLSGSGSPIKTVCTTNSYSMYGKLETEQVEIDTMLDFHDITITKSYENKTTDGIWILGLVSCEQKTSNGETRTTNYTYDTKGRLTQKIIEPNGTITEKLQTDFSYNDSLYPYGYPWKVTETGNNGISEVSRITTYDYYFDPTQLMYSVRKTNPLGHVEDKIYDWRFGKIMTHTDTNGLTTQWLYDGFGRKIWQDRPDGTYTSWAYEDSSASLGTYAICIETSGQPTVIEHYDELDRLIETHTEGFNGQDVVKTVAYNEFGWVDSESRFHFLGGDPQETFYEYDVLGRIVQKDAFYSGTTMYEYNQGGYGLTTIVTNDPDGKNLVNNYTINAQGLLSEVIDSDDSRTRYLYNAFGNLIEVEDAAGEGMEMFYDIRGRKISMQDPDMGEWAYEYNAFGELIRQIDAKGQEIELEYDSLGRLTKRIKPGSGNPGPGCFLTLAGVTLASDVEDELVWEWEYDTSAHGVGKLAQVTGLDGFVEIYNYDAFSRPNEVKTTIDSKTFAITKTYDDFGRISEVNYPAMNLLNRFGVKYQYDSWGYLDQVQDIDNASIVYWQADQLNALGQVVSATLGNGLSAETAFDPLTGRVSEIRTHLAGEYIQDISYQYDLLGNLESRNDLVKGLHESFGYDDLNRLTNVYLNDMPTTSYEYDPVGNMASISDLGNYTYGPRLGEPNAGPHAVSRIGFRTFSYDQNGNMTDDSSGRTIEYDIFNKPVKITKGENEATLVYDPHHNLIKQEVASGPTITTTIYISDLYEKVSSNGNMTEHKHYIKAGNVVIAVHSERSDSTKNTYYLHKDHLGTITLITNEIGQIAADGDMSYAPFGKRRDPDTWTAGTNITCDITKLGFTGHVHLDVVGLIHMKGRVYDPEICRFITPDPLIQDLSNPQTLNRYSYCLNNPLKYVDPEGFFSMSSVGSMLSSLLSGLSNLMGHLGFTNGFDFGGFNIGDIKDFALKTCFRAVVSAGKFLANIGTAFAMESEQIKHTDTKYNNEPKKEVLTKDQKTVILESIGWGATLIIGIVTANPFITGAGIIGLHETALHAAIVSFDGNLPPSGIKITFDIMQGIYNIYNTTDSVSERKE